MKRILITCGGLALLAVSVCGIARGTRASLAQIMYYQAKYGSARENPRAIFRRCESGHRLYPYNYRFCSWTARQAYSSSFHVRLQEADRCLSTALHWCNVGLALNSYEKQLKLLKTLLITRKSVPEAIKYWERYVDWDFWEPHNHAILVELYASIGDFHKAMKSLALINDTKYHAEAVAKLRDAWENDSVSISALRE